MKRIISAIILIAMLMTTALMVLPVSAANEFTVSDKGAFNAVLRAAQVDGADRTIVINAGTTITPDSLNWPDADVTVTVTGGGTLDLSGVGRVNLGCGLTLDNINVIFKNNEYLFANGHPFTITKNANVSYKDTADGDVVFRVYGGANSKDLDGDTYINIQSGIFTYICGGCNGGVVKGNTEVIVGTEGNVNNDTLVDWRGDENSGYRIIGGSGNTGTVEGDISLTVGQYAYADYVIGGNHDGGALYGMVNTYFSGYAGSVYGANVQGENTQNQDSFCDVNLVILGGGARQVYGASNGGMLGSAQDESNVCVKLLGGEITRRVYGGCYNEWSFVWNSSYYVVGTVSVIIGSGVTLNLSDDYGEDGVFANSRQATSSGSEEKRVIFVGAEAQSKHNSKLEVTPDYFDSNHNPSTRHIVSYETNGATLTENCTTCGTSHGSVTLSYKDGMDSCFYTGNPVEFAEISYSGDMMCGTVDNLKYKNNVEVGTATATATIEGIADISLNFTIADRSGAITPNGDYDQEGTIDVSYTTDEAYTITIPDAIALGGVGIKYGGQIKIEMVPDVQRIFSLTISSQNGFKVVDTDTQDALGYCMFYTKDGEIIRYPEDPNKEKATIGEEILIAEVRWDDKDESDDPGITRIESIAFARVDTCDQATGSYTDTLTYTMTPTCDDETLPLVDGKEFDTNEFDVGDDSKLYVKETVAENYEAGVEVFNGYVEDFRKLGFSLYTTNKIDNNHYATLTSENKIINVMYIDYYKDIRVVVDQRSTFDLPGREIENVYTTWAKYSPNLTLIADIDGATQDVTWPGRMGYVYQLADGSFFIIDGGYGKEFAGGGYGSAVPAIEKVLMDHAPDRENIVIAAWLLTHMHEDHFGAFVDLSVRDEFSELKSKITIEKLIYNRDDIDVVTKIDVARGDTLHQNYSNQFQAAVDSWEEDQLKAKIKTHPGQKFYLRNLEVTVYTSQDLLHGSEHYIAGDKYDPLMTGSSALKDSKYLNNTSTTIMVEFEGKKMLYMGDASAATNPYVTERIFDNALKEINILQVAHHGYGDTAAGGVYQKIVDGGNLELVIFPCEAEHFYGNRAPSDYRVDKDVHDAFAISFNGILFATDAKIYVHGQDNITITDFDTYATAGFAHPCQNYREYAK